jgi:hypothetical protein
MVLVAHHVRTAMPLFATWTSGNNCHIVTCYHTLYKKIHTVGRLLWGVNVGLVGCAFRTLRVLRLLSGYNISWQGQGTFGRWGGRQMKMGGYDTSTKPFAAPVAARYTQWSAVVASKTSGGVPVWP